MGKLTNNKRFHLWEWLVERFIYFNGYISIIFIVLIFLFLFKDSYGSLTRNHTYGWELITIDPTTNKNKCEPYFLGARYSATNGEDDFDKGMEDATDEIERERLELQAEAKRKVGDYSLVVACPLSDTKEKAELETRYFPNDIREPVKIGKSAKYYFYVYALPGYNKEKMRLSYAPHKDFNPEVCPFNFNLKLISAPAGVSLEQNEWDLNKGRDREKSESTGDPGATKLMYQNYIDLPTYNAENPEDIKKGYLFEMDVQPTTKLSPLIVNSWIMMTGKNWNPMSEYPQFGLLPLILGSFLVTVGSLIIGLPLGWVTAIYIGEIASPKLREILKPVVELLAAIPSIVVGFLGLLIVAPFIFSFKVPLENLILTLFHVKFELNSGQTALTGAVMLAFMAIPTIVTVTEDAIKSVPKDYKDASFALGATKWETIWRAVVPAARSGFVAAAMLGVGRAIGETMAVVMVAGGSPRIPNGALGFFEPVRTMTATIAQEFGECVVGDTHWSMLFTIGLFLFIITFIINYVSFLYARKGSKFA